MRHVEFKIEITNRKDKYIVDLPDRELGLKDVDRIRKELEVPLLPLKRIYYKTPMTYDRWIYVKIDEFTARDSGHFTEKATARIYVPELFLNQFYKTIILKHRDENTGEVTRAELRYQFYEERFIEWWKAAGYPLEVEAEKEEN